MSMTIRSIKESDNSQIFEIIRKNLAEYHLDIPGTAYFDPELSHLSSFYHKLPDKRHYFIVENDLSEVVGGGGLAEYDLEKKVAELQKMYLSEKAKGQGLSYQLMAQIEKKAKNLGYQQLYLETHHSLEAALYVYRKHGFREIQHPLLESQHTTMDRFFVKDI